MPIDPSISMQVRPPVIPNPMEQVGQVLTLKNLIQQNKTGQANLEQTQLQNKQLQERAADEKALNDAVKLNTTVDDQGRTSIDNEGIERTLAQNGRGRMLMDFRTKLAGMAEAQLEQARKQLEVQSGQAKRKAQIAASITDDRSYHAGVVQAARERLLPPDEVMTLPPTYEAARPMIQQWVTSNMDGAQTLDYLTKQIELEHKKKTGPLEERKAEAEATSAEQKAQGTEPITPYQQEQLDKTPTEVALAMRAAKGDKVAQLALDKLNQSRLDRIVSTQNQITKRTRETQAEITGRMKFTQAKIESRATKNGANPEAVRRSFEAALGAARKLNPNFDDLEDQQKSDLLNTLFESFLANEQPLVAPGEGKPGGFLGLGAAKPVQIVTRQPQQGRGAAPPAGGAVQTVPRAVVQQYATENNVDYATAEAAFRQKGYTIVER